MKILVQTPNYDLVWTEAVYKNNRFYSSDGNRYYDVSGIYAIKDDDRNKTVICSACGKEVPNNPAAIRAHRNTVHKSTKCFECRYLSHSDAVITNHKYVLNEDGTYSESTKRNVSLKCRYCYPQADINSAEAKHRCQYAACENAKFNHIEDFWTQHPDAFDEFITVDKIVESGYKYMYKYHDHISFGLKGRANLTALVNNQGICYGFDLDYRRKSYQLRYSKKYDKVWVLYGGDFKALSFTILSSDAKEIVIKKLKTLYN